MNETPDVHPHDLISGDIARLHFPNRIVREGGEHAADRFFIRKGCVDMPIKIAGRA